MSTRTKSQLIGNVSTGASFAGIVTATELSSDTVNVSGASTIANITFSSGIITATSGVVTFYGDGGGLTGISAGSTVFDDTSTDATFYPVFTDTTSGLLSTSRVSTTNLTFNPSSSTLNVGTGITLSGSDGSISIAGTIYASSLNVPIGVSSFDPVADTTASVTSSIIINFNQTVGLGTTGFIEIRTGAAVTETISAGSTRSTLSNGGTTLTISPVNIFPGTENITPVMTSGFITANGSDFAGINTVGSGVTYSFQTGAAPGPLGSASEGGIVICKSGGTGWIIAPSSTEVIRTWYDRNDAITLAEAQAACGDWFIPSIAQLQNPGYQCRTYWDSIAPFTAPGYQHYWSCQSQGSQSACVFRFCQNFFGATSMTAQRNARAFRCVTY